MKWYWIVVMGVILLPCLVVIAIGPWVILIDIIQDFLKDRRRD
jgi:hypothetical protein